MWVEDWIEIWEEGRREGPRGSVTPFYFRLSLSFKSRFIQPASQPLSFFLICSLTFVSPKTILFLRSLRHFLRYDPLNSISIFISVIAFYLFLLLRFFLHFQLFLFLVICFCRFALTNSFAFCFLRFYYALLDFLYAQFFQFTFSA